MLVIILKVLRITIKAELVIETAYDRVNRALIVRIRENGNIFGKDQAKLQQEFDDLQNPFHVPGAGCIDILMSKVIMEKCGGYLLVETKSRNQTQFELMLPIKEQI